MKKLLVLFLAAAAAVVAGGEIEFKNANFSLTFETRGGMIRKLIHNNVDWNASGPENQGNSFCDSRLGVTVEPKAQYNEDFSKLEYELVSWKSYPTTGWADITFSVKGTVYDWLRLNKTYKIRTGNTLEVAYELVNTSDKAQPVSFSTRCFFHRSDRENIYWLPGAKGVKKLKQQKYMFYSKLPPRTYLAIGSEDDSGALLEYPADSTAGLMTWFIKGRYASTEYFSDEVVIPPKGKRAFSVKLHMTQDLKKLIAEKKFTARPLKGGIPAMVDHLNLQEDRSYKIRTLKGELAKDPAYFDVKLKQQFKDSWRAVVLPADIPLDRIAVFRMANGVPSFDRPVGYVLNGRELLLKIPGFHPAGLPRNSTLKNGILTENSGRRISFRASDYNCRIFYNRPDGLKLNEKAPAGGELIPNGTFDEADPGRPSIPANHNFVANPNYNTEYLKQGGIGNSPCLRGGGTVFPMIPEPGRSLNLSFMVKNEGGESILRCYMFFYDADGKRLMKLSPLMFSSKASFGWKKVEKKIFIPENAVMMQLAISRSAKKSARVLIDNVSARYLPISCTKVSALEQGRKELKEQWGVPVDFLEQLSLEVANPHKKWFSPAEKSVDVLYLPFENDRGRLLKDKRMVVELAQRMPMDIKVIPVLRKIISSTGIYGVNRVIFGKELSTYTAESLKALSHPPKVVLVTQMIPKQFNRELEEIFANWQRSGTHFIVLSGSFFQKLQGKAVKPPVRFMLPEMKSVARNRAFSWYKKGKSYVVICNSSAEHNPLIPVEDEVNAVPFRLVYFGRDYPWWEYQELAKIQILRYLSGSRGSISFVSGSEKALVVNSSRSFSGTVELEYRNMFRELKHREVLKVNLKQGLNQIALPSVTLPGGRFVTDARLLDAKGKVQECGAFVIKKSEKVKVQLAFKNREKIFPQGSEVAFDLNVANAPAGSVIETEVEDSFRRIIARRSFPAGARQTISLQLPAPRTVLNNLIWRIKHNGVVLAEGIDEFSSPAGPTDFTEFFGMTWGFQRYLARHLELDGVTSNSPYNVNVQGIYRAARYENLAAGPMGLASVRNTLPYRGDRKSDPVRNPCFHDPAYLAKNTELLEKSYSKRNLLKYYDIRDFWSGDELFLGSTVCYSPHCLKKFREVLKKEYKDIAALNQVWGTDFSGFDKVVPQQLDELKSKDNLAPWLEHKLFMAATFAWGQFGSHLPDLKKYNPYARMGASGTQSPGYSYDWVQYMKHCGIMSYYSGIQVKLVHDLGGKDILAGRWGTYCYADADQETYCVTPLWQGLLRGSNMAAIWPPTMTNGDGAPTRNLRFVKPVLDELRSGMTKLWLTGTAKPRIALLYSQSSLYAAMATFGGSEWLNSQNSWMKVLDDMKYDCRYLSYEQVAGEGIPAQYKVVILPAAVSLSDAEICRLEKFVREGGTLIADFAPGRYDGHGKRRNSALLAKLFTPSDAPIEISYADLPQLGGKFKVAEKQLPVLTVRSYGKGRTVLFNFSISDYFFIQLGGVGGELSTESSADAKLQLAIRQIVGKELERSGVYPSMKVIDSGNRELPCMALVRWDGATGTAAVFKSPQLPRLRGHIPPPHNRIDRKKGHAVTVTLPFKGHLYETRTGKYLGYGNSFKSFLVPGIANFYSVQPVKVTGMVVKAPELLNAGESVNAVFSLPQVTSPQIFNVKLIDPAGKEQRIFRKNIRTPGGSGNHTFQIPFNAPRGKWQLCITHVNTKLTKIHTFEVK